MSALEGVDLAGIVAGHTGDHYCLADAGGYAVHVGAADPVCVPRRMAEALQGGTRVAAVELEPGQRFRAGMLAGTVRGVREGASSEAGRVRVDYSDGRGRQRCTFLDGSELVTLEGEL